MPTSAFLLVLITMFLFATVRTAPVVNSSVCENDLCSPQPSALPKGIPWSLVDVPSHSNNSFDGGKAVFGSFNDGDAGDLDFVDSVDVDVANTDAAPLCSPPANAATLDLVKKFQPFSPKIVQNIRGLPSIGFGHRCIKPKCEEAGPSPISEDTGLKLLKEDLSTAIKSVSSIVDNNVPLTDNNIGALASLSSTVDLQELKNSGLIRQLNTGRLAPNMVEMLWLSVMGKHGDGGKLGDQTARRKAEAALFQKASQVKVHPLPAECKAQLKSAPLNAASL